MMEMYQKRPFLSITVNPRTEEKCKAPPPLEGPAGSPTKTDAKERPAMFMAGEVKKVRNSPRRKANAGRKRDNAPQAKYSRKLR